LHFHSSPEAADFEAFISIRLFYHLANFSVPASPLEVPPLLARYSRPLADHLHQVCQPISRDQDTHSGTHHQASCGPYHFRTVRFAVKHSKCLGLMQPRLELKTVACAVKHRAGVISTVS